MNGDGFDDVIIADPEQDDRYGNAVTSSSYVMFGKASGFSAVADLSDLEGDEGFRLDDAGILVTSVSGAGDVNGDGFDDLIAGASRADLNGYDSGSSYVIFGRSDFTGGPDFLGTPGDDVFTGTSAAESFVTWDGDDRMIGGGGADSFVGGAGDDVMQIADVGFVLANGGSDFDTLEWAGGGFSLNLSNAGDRMQSIEAIDMTGSVNHRLILSVLDVLNLSDETNTLRIKGNAGDSVAGLGSGWVDGGIQGDVRTYIQFDAVLQIDVAVRTDFVDDNAISLFSLNGSNGFRLDGETAHDRSGRSVSTAGDVNGDGFDDVIVGAHGANPNGGYSGSSYVVFGKASGFDATMNLSDLDGSNGFRLDGVAKYDYSGRSVSNAGDVNGDGFDDVIVGARGADTNGEHSGSSYVVFGKAAGFDAAMNLSDLDGSNGFRLDGEAASDRGRSVSNAGDVNGDGFDDVIIGAHYANPNGNDSGSSYVVFGKASGFDATMNLSDLDGNNGFRLDGETAHDRSGWSVSSAGDVNGDGFDDVIIAALYAHPNGSYSGSSYVVFGKATGFDAAMNLSGLDGGNGFRLDGGSVYDLSVSSAGDVNGDGFDDVVIGVPDVDPNGERSGSSYVVFGKTSGFDATMDLSSLDGANGFRLDGVAKRDDSGRSVSSAGDVNGDGFDDVIVDAMDSSYVVFGKVSGFDAVMNLSDLDGSTGFRIDAVTKHYSFSGSVSGAGDVNGDDFDDLIVGAAGADQNNFNSGSSYIIFGRSDFVSNVDFPGTAGDDELTGTKAAERFEAGAGNDKMIGRGGADEFYGQAGDDYIRVSDLNFQWVDGGTGRDTLGLGGSGLNLDLSSVNGRISDIETIYLYGTGDNTLTLTALDVLNLSDTSNTLRVNGNEGDRIVGLGSGWDDSGIHGKFNTYTQGEAVLLVGVNVATDFV
ncbi:MAG: FG-GAP repeat protein [Nitrosomonas sp.]|nr:FG-GAP repeat protein [Nitrosomonas sp.]